MATSPGVGIDVSKDKVDVASTCGSVQLTAKTTKTGLRKLMARLARLDPHRVVLEASGGYEDPVLHAAFAADLRVISTSSSR